MNFETTDLETIIADVAKQLESVLDEIAPERTKSILVRPTSPWFTEEVKAQKRLMRNREQQWRKYKLQSNWIALKTIQLATSKEQCYGLQGNPH